MAERLTCPFDHRVPTTNDAQREVFDRHRDQYGVSWTDSHGGFWVVSRYSDVVEVLRSPRKFTATKFDSGEGGQNIPPVGMRRFLPSEGSFEEHSRIRSLIQPLFSRRALLTYEPELASLATELVNAVVAKQRFDIVTDLANVYSATAAFDLLGVPMGERSGVAEAVFLQQRSIAGGEQEVRSVEVYEEYLSRIVSVIEQRQRQRDSGTNWLSKLAALVLGGDLTMDDALSVVLSLTLGGMRNTASWIAACLLKLDDDRALRAMLIDDPLQVPWVCEEILRMFVTTRSVARTAVDDTIIGEQFIRSGERVLLLLGSANHDGAVFPDSDSAQSVRRGMSVAFGVGDHLCLGAGVARIEVAAVVRAMLSTAPDYGIVRDECVESNLIGTTAGWISIPAFATDRA